MKKFLFILGLIGLISSHFIFDAQAQSVNFWYPAGDNLTPVTSAWGVSSTQFCLSGSCINVWPAGSGGSSTQLHSGAGWNVTALVNGNQTGTLDTTYAASWSALETFLKGITVNGTTTLASTTNALLVTNNSGTVLAYAGSNVCGSGNAATAVSPTGTVTCSPVVTSVNGSSGSITITSSSLGVVTNYVSTLQGLTTSSISFVTSTQSQTFNITTQNGNQIKLTIPPASDYLPSSTVYVSTVNGASGAITISSSSLGVIYTPTTTITASGTTVNGNNFTFGSTTDILVYPSGTIEYWKFASHNVSQFTNNAGYVTSSIVNGYATSSNAGTGSCTNCNITVNGNGIVTSIANGSNGTGGGLTSSTPWSANSFPFIVDGSTLRGASELSYSTSTGQIKYTATASDNPGGSISTGGLVNITATNSTSTGLEVYSNQASTQQGGRLFIVNCGVNFNTYDCALIENQATGTTALDIQSWAAGKGAVKIEHNQPTDGSSDANASALSIALNGATTTAQGVFINIGSSTGNAVHIQNNSTDLFEVSSSGIPRINNLVSAPLLGTDASGNVRSVATSSLGLQPALSFPLAYGSTTHVGAGAYLGLSGNNLTVSSTLASSTLNLNIYNATTTAPNYSQANWDFQRTFTSFGCHDAVGTTTLLIYNTTGATSTTKNADVVAGAFPCGVNGNTTTTFTSSTLLANYSLIVQVTSTAGTPTLTNVWMTSYKQ